MKIGSGIKEVGLNDICFRCPEVNACHDLEVMKALPIVKFLFMIICNRKGGADE